VGFGERGDVFTLLDALAWTLVIVVLIVALWVATRPPNRQR
jgi:hypothetical protein